MSRAERFKLKVMATDRAHDRSELAGEVTKNHFDEQLVLERVSALGYAPQTACGALTDRRFDPLDRVLMSTRSTDRVSLRFVDRSSALRSGGLRESAIGS